MRNSLVLAVGAVALLQVLEAGAIREDPRREPVELFLRFGEGKVHVVQCGANICGYAVDKNTGADGAQVLINMKPDGNSWHGRIHDTRGGGTYDSTVAMPPSATCSSRMRATMP